MTETATGSSEPASGPAASSIDAIPGLGPIRARALKKAGLDTVERLLRATPAELCAVPGITEVKAVQLQAYLRGEAERVGIPAAPRGPKSPAGVKRAARPPAPKTRPDAATATPASRRLPADRKPATAPDSAGSAKARTAKPLQPPQARKPAAPYAPAAPAAIAPIVPEAPPMRVDAVGDHPVAVSAGHVSAAANDLLRASNASTYARPFARQIGKIAALAERIALEAGASGTDTARTLSQLRKLVQLLDEIRGVDSLGAKRQDRFADELRERRHKLLEAFDSEPAHDRAADQTAASKKSARGEQGDKKSRRDK